MSETSGYIGLTEAAQWASVSSRTLKRWMDQGLPFYQLGPRTKLLLRRGDIDVFLQRREKKIETFDSRLAEKLQELKDYYGHK